MRSVSPHSGVIAFFEDLVSTSSTRFKPVEFDGISSTADHGDLTIPDDSGRKIGRLSVDYGLFGLGEYRVDRPWPTFSRRLSSQRMVISRRAVKYWKKQLVKKGMSLYVLRGPLRCLKNQYRLQGKAKTWEQFCPFSFFFVDRSLP